ncbi:NADPH-dependent FMN reductase [Halalkalibacter alkaliphilus]|uniref:NADPH-dependent FMN reductase n=1 Tax=Halalkalibacter alkaliphilus TaxID=2917993 RepID=A0A9X2CV96_9BACI|nr:NADPH-dependent FMN reductase [Halalkalibacter alkaliphilus]
MNKIVIISGSPTSFSRLNSLLKYTKQLLEKAEMEVSVVQVCELPSEELLHAKWDAPAIKEANMLIEEAEAIVIGTPIYKASFSGVLKTFLDLLPENGLKDKGILPLAIGGTRSHLLMLEYSLKPILSVLGATHIEKGVFVQNVQVSLNEEGETEIASVTKTRLIKSVDRFVTTMLHSEVQCQ